MQTLKNKIILITGASKGIGRAAAIAFAKEDCTVIVNFKSDSQAAQNVVNECNKYSQGNMAIKADISDEEAVSSMFKTLKEKFSHLDILINSAGIFIEGDNYANIEIFTKIFKNNFLGCVLVTKYALSLMTQGKIVNVSSINGRLGYGESDSIAYSSFKAALDNYTKNLAKELAPKILVNAVAPGRVATAMWGNPTFEEQKELGKAHLTKKMIQPEEIADAILFLVKNDAMCGEILTIDAGNSLANI